jgi:hypothetical protein
MSDTAGVKKLARIYQGPCPVCPYCGLGAELVPDVAVYGFPGYGRWVYVCSGWPVCDAYVGTHPGTDEPLGSLADGGTRHWRLKAHQMLDPLWRSGLMRRPEAYQIAAHLLGLSNADMHIGNLSIAQCRELIAGIRALRFVYRRIYPTNT